MRLTATDMDPSLAKRRAAQEALTLLPPVGVVGLGSGSTAALFIEGVADALRSGKQLVCVATSEQSRRQALRLNIPLLENAGPWDIDLCVDGADEVSENLDLIKGGGGCHLREKIVNQSSRCNVIIVDESKLSERLGQRSVVPVEVVVFGHAGTARWLRKYGDVALRVEHGEPWRTDTGNIIYDIKLGAIDDPAKLDDELHGIPGVVETGLFVARADILIVGSATSVRRVERRSLVRPL
jgi:ribose 5-phosphate isomerase A